MTPEVKIRLSAVITAALANMVVGAVWYSPRVWGKPWLALMGWNQKELQARQRHLARAYGWTFVSALILAYFLAHCVLYMKAETPAYGALVGVWVWLGFVATTSVGAYLFGGRSPKLYLIDQGCQVAMFAVMGVILAVML